MYIFFVFKVEELYCELNYHDQKKNEMYNFKRFLLILSIWRNVNILITPKKQPRICYVVLFIYFWLYLFLFLNLYLCYFIHLSLYLFIALFYYYTFVQWRDDIWACWVSQIKVVHVLYSHIHIYICMQNHNDDTIKTATQFLEKYTSHFIWKGCVWEGVGDRTELQHIDPNSYGHQRFFPVLLGRSTGSPGAQLSAGSVFSTASYLQLVWSPNSQSGVPRPLLLDPGFLDRILFPTGLVSKLTDLLSSPSYIIVQRSPSSCGRHNFALIQPVHGKGYNILIIPRSDAPVIYTGGFPILTARPGRRSIYNTWA